MAAISQHAFLHDGGELADLIASFNWSETSLGAISAWPDVLKTTISLILRSKLPMASIWGQDGVLIYNAAYAELSGARHPSILGSKVDVAWPEAADFNLDVVRRVLSGEAISYRDIEFTLDRPGRSSQAWFDLDYSPICGSDGKPLGILAVVIETSEKVKAKRWLEGEKDRLRNMFHQAPGFVAMMRGPEHVFELVNQAYLKLVGNRDVIGQPAREAYPDLEGQGYFELLDQVYTTGKPYVGHSIPIIFQNEPGSQPEKKYIDLIYQPVTDPEGKIVGIFAQGSDVTDRVLVEDTLRSSEEQSRQILDSAVDYAIVALTMEGRILRWNEGARRSFGWTQDEVVGQDWEILFSEEDRALQMPREAMDRALKDGRACHERWHKRKNGERFWANGEINLLRDVSGLPVGFVKVLRDRTVQHLAEQSLKDAEASLRRAQQAGGVGLFTLDMAADLLTATPEFCRIFGLPESQLVPITTIQNLVVPEDQDLASNPVGRRTGTSTLSAEYRIRRADNGEERVIARKGEFEYEEGTAPVRFVGVVQDVTERRKAQQDLRDSEARFRALAQAIPTHVWTARPDGSFDWYNERVYEFSGRSFEELGGDGWTSILHPEDVDAVRQLWSRAVATGQTYQAEFRLLSKNGDYRWHTARAISILGENGHIRRWVGTSTDIEEERATRKKLEELNRTLEERVAERTADRDRMWRFSQDIMLVADFSAQIIAINPAWTRVLGWSEEDLLQTSFLDLIHPDDIDATLNEVGRLQQGATTFNFENRYQCRDGSYRIISWTATPDAQFMHAVGRDITERLEAESALRKTELALQQAQKMESIGNLTGGVAHDFNNLLQVVSGNLQLLERDLAGNEQALRRVTNALEGVNRGSKLAAQLLAFGRRQALDPRVVNVGRLVNGVDELVRRTIGDGIEVNTVVSEGLWNILVDPTQIENALLNLAINARDAMSGFGILTIRAENFALEADQAPKYEDLRAGEYIAISVMDTGTGMSAEVMEKVFEPFFSTKPEGKGTGLGLSMVYGFVKQSGGHVEIESEVGKGTVVRMFLPRAFGAEQWEEEVTGGTLERGSETILVAEDDDGVRATVVEILHELGYRVLEARDAEAAMTVIESGASIDLLFTDVVMPGPLKSPELAKKVQERFPSIAVLFTSGYTENSIVHEGRLDPGVQLLPKPYTREQLARKIRQVLNNHQAQAEVEKDRTNEQAVHDRSPVGDIGRNLRVLLVEDDMLIRMGNVDMVADLGHEAFEAESGSEALSILETDSIDILVTDLGLPGMSGEELARQVRQRWPHIGIVFATGRNEVCELPDPQRVTLLSKPFGTAQLGRAIKAVSTMSIET
ncbi:PAS domain S-box protein [Oryzifoliimicrobium ureilyticus]|uniref:PAS domain S-box protein n=1 Tax=Oryzifoliimicrobium ureilyticus TaxID=3113724 RepID=UPI00307687F1